MNYLTQADFKSAIKNNKSISAPIRKDYSAPVQITGDRQAKFIFSSESVDRDFDIIVQDGIDLTYFLQNPVIFYGHDHDSLPIGKCVSIGIENGCLAGVIEFVQADNPAVGNKAEGIYQLVVSHFLSTVSIGFIPKTIEYPEDARNLNDGVNVLTSELVEVSICGIPANRDCLVQTVSQPQIIQELQDQSEASLRVFRSARLKRVLDAIL